MSARQRRQATPDEFASLVQDYYHNKEPYNTLLQAFLNKPFTMPVHPSEENVTGSLTDQVAKDSKDSTASDHSLHDVDTGAKSAPHAKLEDSGSAPGIVIPENMPESASREELRAKAAELNK